MPPDKEKKTNGACVLGDHDKCPIETAEYKCICPCHQPDNTWEKRFIDKAREETKDEIYGEIGEKVLALLHQTPDNGFTRDETLSGVLQLLKNAREGMHDTTTVIAANDAGYEAGRRAAMEEIEKELPDELEKGTPRGNQDESSIGWNQCRDKILSTIKRMKKA